MPYTDRFHVTLDVPIGTESKSISYALLAIASQVRALRFCPPLGWSVGGEYASEPSDGKIIASRAEMTHCLGDQRYLTNSRALDRATLGMTSEEHSSFVTEVVHALLSDVYDDQLVAAIERVKARANGGRA